MSMRPTRFAGFFSSPARSPNAALISFTVSDGGAHELVAVARHRAEQRARRAPDKLGSHTMVLRWPPQPGPLGAGFLPDVLGNLWTIPPSPPNAPPLRQAGTILPPMPPGMGVYGKSYAP